jgi:N-formylglutamate amidohydrolase
MGATRTKPRFHLKLARFRRLFLDARSDADPPQSRAAGRTTNLHPTSCFEAKPLSIKEFGKRLRQDYLGYTTLESIFMYL